MKDAIKEQRLGIRVLGIVQGVGFRPHVYRIAMQLGLKGWVRNFSGGVDIEIQGKAADCAAFVALLAKDAPPAGRIDNIDITKLPLIEEAGFVIQKSALGSSRSLIAPDLAICADCRAELLNPKDRRYRYPFINCTNCGPRFTIIRDLPYDRPLTTMKDFAMCPPCREEYEDALNRRFHAQPIACGDCGPGLSFWDAKGQPLPGDALSLAKEALKNGAVVAVKGLGGYHLACDAANDEAVSLLRKRKKRQHKPFALMLPTIERIRAYCRVSPEEEELLGGVQSPIVLLQPVAGAPPLAEAIAPGQSRLGIMLPYTPLHVLLMEDFDALVMTSANYSDEPIVYDDNVVLQRLSSLADYFLLHNRPIFRRVDDSVAIYAAGLPRLLRRSRGYAPQPLALPHCKGELLAAGGQEKNTFCLTRPGEAFLSQHIGDLDDVLTLGEYKTEIEYFKTMFGIKPQAIACDMHPDYASVRFAEQSGLPCVYVQHHHGHLASVLAEHNLDTPITGLIFDGTGYGTDGNLWGGEVLLGDYGGFKRLAHLSYLPLPGGAAAIREPWRQAMAALYTCGGEDLVRDTLWSWPKGWQIVLQSLKQQVNTVLACGMGRLFDAVAALAGLYPFVDYEGQAAIGLEHILDEKAQGAYSFNLTAEGEIAWQPVIWAIVEDRRQNVPGGIISARFHQGVAELCVKAAQRYAGEAIALSGGCWQNVWLLKKTTGLLQEAGFKVYSNSLVPVNDGGLSLGQAAIAARQLGQLN